MPLCLRVTSHANETGKPRRDPALDRVPRLAAMIRLLGLAALLGCFCGAVTASRGDAAGSQTLTIYSVATGVQFINTADDRARGAINNPFNSSTDKLAPKTTGTGNGPFPGDVVLYSLDLYKEASLRRSAGSAVYTCYFNYTRHALCQAYYILKGAGTLVASGPIDFKLHGFTIVVTGGTKKYLGASGEAVVVPAARKAQRLDFRLLT